jgi:hypothetical protein
VSAETRDRAAALLAGRSGGLQVGVDGDLISVGGAKRESIPELIQMLVSSGVRIYQVTAQRPTLEDVYFELHRLADQEG